jgi:hypothetical protein
VVFGPPDQLGGVTTSLPILYRARGSSNSFKRLRDPVAAFVLRPLCESNRGHSALRFHSQAPKTLSDHLALLDLEYSRRPGWKVGPVGDYQKNVLDLLGLEDRDRCRCVR